MSSSPRPVAAEAHDPEINDHEIPHTIGPHLPLPGKAPGWPFATIGKWKMDVNAAAEGWLAALTVWRREHLIRIGYDDAQYRRPELLWSQRNFVHTQMMVEDRYFHDPVTGRYTIDRYLDDLETRYGGIDSVLIWYVYPNIGIDDRNQIELAADLPGGIDGLRGAVADFHRRGVKVFLPTMPWDNGTREVGKSDWQAIAELAKAVNADGVNGDTYNGVPRAFRDACDAIGHPLVFQPESTASAEEALLWNHQSWGKASTEMIPAVSKFKWLEPRHLINVENRWGRDRSDDLHYIFFNGIGYTSWENVWGIWNQLTERDGEALRRIATIERRFAPQMVSADWRPYAPTLQAGVFASRFPKGGITLWTLVNRNEYAVGGEQMAVPHRPGTRYVDAWNGGEARMRITGDHAVFDADLEVRGFGALVAIDPDTTLDGLDAFIARMHAMSAKPLHMYSKQWRFLPQRIVAIEATKRVAQVPSGMTAIPAGTFDFVVGGIEIEGQTWAGLDVQCPWEDSPRRHHRKLMQMRPFHIDTRCVTNAAFKRFVDDVHYSPRDSHHFLTHWKSGRPQAGWENRPVTWVSIEDARAYAAWAGKRLPHEWEWQYAAQGSDGRRYPWGDTWNATAVPPLNRERLVLPPEIGDAHPDGASPFGVLDLVGNVWQWTDEYQDDHTRSAILRGGSPYRPRSSHWYFPQTYRLDQHGKYLLMAPCKDRSACIGFRCVVDAG